MFRPLSPGHHQVTIVPNTDNLWYLQFYIFTILYWLHILSYRITTRSRCILSLRDSFSWITVYCFLKFYYYLWPDDGLVIEAETCCHLVTLNKINIHNTSCVLTCESLLLICIIRPLFSQPFMNSHWYFPIIVEIATSQLFGSVDQTVWGYSMEHTWTSVVGSDPSARRHNPRQHTSDTRVVAVISQELLDHPPYRIDLFLSYCHLFVPL